MMDRNTRNLSPHGKPAQIVTKHPERAEQYKAIREAFDLLTPRGQAAFIRYLVRLNLHVVSGDASEGQEDGPR